MSTSFSSRTLFECFTLALVLAFGAIGLSGTASAQQGQPGQQGVVSPDSPQEGGDSSYSDEEIEAFAKANVRVSQIQQKLNKKLENAEDRSKAQEIQQKFIDRMDEAIAEEGLDYSTYREIAMEANQDPELRSKIQEAMGQ